MEISVNDPSLQKALAECALPLNSFAPTINQASQDIKGVEQFLREKELPLGFEHKIHSYFVEDEDENPNFDTTEMYLRWAPYEKQGYRLLLAVRSVPPQEGIHYELIDERPAIESTIADRMHVHKHLSTFVREITQEALKVLAGYEADEA